MPLSARLAAWSAALFLSAPALAAPTTLFNSLDENDSSTGDSTIIYGPEDPFTPTNVAIAFTVTGGTYAFESVEFVISSNTDSGTVRVRLFADDQGLPGTLLETIDYTGPFSTTFGSPDTILFASSLHPTLADGATYWVAVNFLNEGKSVYLYNNNQDIDIVAAQDYSNDGSWTLSDNIDPAFRVIGSIPEPATAMLLAAGALVMVRRRG